MKSSGRGAVVTSFVLVGAGARNRHACGLSSGCAWRWLEGALKLVNLGRVLAIASVVPLISLVSCGAQQSGGADPPSPVTGPRAKCTMEPTGLSGDLRFTVRCGQETRLGKAWCVEGCPATLHVGYFAQKTKGSGTHGSVGVDGRCVPRDDATECSFSNEAATRVFEGERTKIQTEYDRFAWTGMTDRPDVSICVGQEPGANLLPKNFVYAKPTDGDAVRVVDTVKSMEQGSSSSVATKKDDADLDIPDGPAKTLGKEEITVLVDALPLRRDAVRFQAIDRFILLYAPFTGNKAMLRKARLRFRNAKACLQVEVPSVATATEPRQFNDILKHPTGSYFPVLLENLLGGLTTTRSIISDFYEQVRDRKLLTQDQTSLVLAQIGSGPGTGSIFSENYAVFDQLQKQFQNVRR